MKDLTRSFSRSHINIPDSHKTVFRLVLISVVLLLAVSACANSSSMTKSGHTKTDKIADEIVVVNSENQDTRVRVIVIHHTSEDFAGSMHVLTKDTSRPVSSHYLIPEPLDPSYTEEELKLYQLVPEEARAWHAGGSYWDRKTALNDMSIGIEIVNQTYCRNAQSTVVPEQSEMLDSRICFFPDFAEPQIVMLTDLLAGILERHEEVTPTNIVGHSDIAPQRKIDPGPRFPWQRLYKLGYGAWFDDETVVKYWEQFRQQMPSTLTLQKALHEYGYGLEISGVNDEQSRNVVRAFQLHFVPYRVTSEFDAESAAILYALLEKYHPERLEKLLLDSIPIAGADSITQ